MNNIYHLKKRKQRALILGFVFALLFEAILIFFGFFSRFWPIVAGLLIYFRMNRSDKVLIWLRRFHKKDKIWFRFRTSLSLASFGLCVPITIQDSSFKTSYKFSRARFIFILPILFGIGLILVLGIGFVSWFFLSKYIIMSKITHIVISISISTCVLAFYLYSIKKFFELKGYKRLNQKDAEFLVNKIINKIKKRKWQSSGITILKCGDEFWQNVVIKCLEGADAVIIDVSEITENLLWELKNVARIFPTESIIFACSVDEGKKYQLSQKVRTKLDSIFNRIEIERIPVIYYPSNTSYSDNLKKNLYKSITHNLKKTIMDCLYNSSKSDADIFKIKNRSLKKIITDYFIALIAFTSLLFIIFSVIFGPYDLKNALEATLGSFVISIILTLPFLAWQVWHKRSNKS